MSGEFVELTLEELAALLDDPSGAEALFDTNGGAVGAGLEGGLEDRVRTLGPVVLAPMLDQLDPDSRQRLEEQLGVRTDDLLAGRGGDDLVDLLRRRTRPAASATGTRGGAHNDERPAKERTRLSLDKNWHGIHYLLCGAAEPGDSLASQIVLGGTELDDDPEGFSGYGPARVFRADQVAAMGRVLVAPEFTAEAQARFDPDTMSRLGIYPGWTDDDRDYLLQDLGRLRDFFDVAAHRGHAIVTCLI
jgi:Domain of unknown function (DUF1877)